jgi:hypothetical protein
MAAIAPAPTGNPILDDADSGAQTYDHPTTGNPLLTDADVGNRSVSGTNDDTGPTGLMSRSWMSLKDVGSEPPPPSQTPVRDLARNASAAVGRGTVNSLDLITNPSQAVFRPLMTLGGAAWDAAAPSLGLPRMTPEQRADITGAGAPPAEQGDIAQVASALPKGFNPYAVRPRTPLESQVATALEGATTGAQLGGFGPLGVGAGGLLGGLGALAGGNVASYAPDWAKPSVEMATNMLIQGAGGAFKTPPGRGIDPAVASIANTARQEGVPFTAPDITPGSHYSNPAPVSDALQGNMLRELNLDPNTGDPVTTNRVTPTNIGQAKTDAGADMRAITNTNNVGAMQSYRLLQQLQQAENTIDTTAGVTDSDRAQMRARIGEIRGAINRNTGQMDGTDYQSLTNTDSPLDRLAGNANPDMAKIGRGLMTNLDQAFRSSLSPDDQTAHTDARYRYRLASTLDPLADKYQGRTLPMNEVADALYGQQQKYGSVPNSQLDRFMSQASLISDAPPQTNPASPVSNLTSPAGMTALALSSHPAGVVAGAAAPWALQKIIGPFARAGGRANEQIAGAMTNPRPPPGQPWYQAMTDLNNARLRQALSALVPASAN